MVLQQINDLLLEYLLDKFDGENYRRVELALKPVPAGRPRLSKWGVYYSKTYTTYRNEAREHVGDWGEPLVGSIIAVLDVRFPKPKTKATNHYPLPDVDNLAKSFLDVIVENKTVIQDDKLIIGAWLNKRYADSEDDVGTTVHLFQVGDYKRQ